jgi:hypothetical protein
MTGAKRDCSCRAAAQRKGRRSDGVVWLRGSVVIDKSFVIMVLACAVAPIVGAGIYVMVLLF